MSSAQELKRRIRSVASTEQVARAMRTAAMSKYTRTHKKAQDFAPYREQCVRLLSAVGDGGAPGPRAGKVCYVAITANRGLCGNYNEALFRFLRQTLDAETEAYRLILCGKWGADRAAARGFGAEFSVRPLDSVPTYAQALALYRELRAGWEAGEFSRVVFVYQRFQNILTQTPACEQLLPALTGASAGGEDIIFVPGRDALLPGLREQCLASQVYGILLTAAAGAHGAMLMAMRTAADNSGEMRAALELELNRMRQAAVTTEVIELSGGAGTQEEKTTW